MMRQVPPVTSADRRCRLARGGIHVGRHGERRLGAVSRLSAAGWLSALADRPARPRRPQPWSPGM